MRVLRISHSAVVSAWRGRERELRRLGVDVELLSARVWNEGGRTVRLAPEPGEHVAAVGTLGRHPALFCYAPGPLWRALGEDWDVLDIHEEPFALATAEVLAIRWLRNRLSGRPACPYVLYSAQNVTKRYPWPFRALEARALAGAAGISVCNAAAGRIVRAKGMQGVVEMIPLGVELERDAAAVTVGPADITTITVGYAGRLAPHKGVAVLLDAVAADARLTLRIAGAGPDESALRRRARSLGDRVRFDGPLDAATLPAFYRDLDVLAVPSLTTARWTEQFGRVAVEAMACGVPVVASASGALPDVVGDAGLLVPEADPGALAAALLRAGTDAALRERLIRAGARRAAQCSWRAVASRYLRLYQLVMAEGRTADDSDTDADAGGATSPDDIPAPEVVVVAYGRPDLLAAALTPLAGRLPVTVVDNSSRADVRAVAERAGARYLDPHHNGGFAAGVNHALARHHDPERDVLLLNPDAVLDADDIAALQRALHADRRAASAGPAQVDAAGRPTRVRWPFPSPAAAWLEAVGLGRLRHQRAGTGFVIGSALLLRARALADVGPLDERFFLYAEETDWARRATAAGWHHIVAPGARAVHVGGATSTDAPVRETHFHASQERYLRKHFGPAGWNVARAASVCGAALRSVVLSGPGRSSARRRLRLYVRGPVAAELALADEPVGTAG